MLNQEEYARLRALRDAENIATDKYLDLRDAKSNGYCHGWSIAAVMEYDRRIMAAHDEIIKARAAILTFQEEMKLKRSEAK